MSHEGESASKDEYLNLPFIAVGKNVVSKYGRKLGPIGIAVYCALLTGVAGSSREEMAENVASLLGNSKRNASAGLRRLESQKFIEFNDEECVILR